MPIKRRGKPQPLQVRKPKNHTKDGAGIKKRIPAKSKLIYTSAEGVLVVRTPPECTNWPNEFRLRIVRDFISPKQMMPVTKYASKFVDTGYQDVIYKVHGKEVQIKQPIEEINKTNFVAVIRTEVRDLTMNRAMFLYHDDPAMRCLMTWAFINEKVVPGMPKLQVYPIEP